LDWVNPLMLPVSLQEGYLQVGHHTSVCLDPLCWIFPGKLTLVHLARSCVMAIVWLVVPVYFKRKLMLIC
jgi:hypothetical protein